MSFTQLRKALIETGYPISNFPKITEEKQEGKTYLVATWNLNILKSGQWRRLLARIPPDARIKTNGKTIQSAWRIA